MQRLSKSDQATLTELVRKLESQESKVEEAVNELNSVIASHLETVESAIEAYNEVVRDANEFRDNINTEQNEFFSEKSEKWQEGEKGDAYSSWMGEWENELPEATIELPAEVQVELTASVQLAELPIEP
jgi:chromosome segregation ATPase